MYIKQLHSSIEGDNRQYMIIACGSGSNVKDFLPKGKQGVTVEHLPSMLFKALGLVGKQSQISASDQKQRTWEDLLTKEQNAHSRAQAKDTSELR